MVRRVDLPTFCFIYGILGHSEQFCDRLFDIPMHLIEKPYNLELKAPPRRRHHNIGAHSSFQGSHQSSEANERQAGGVQLHNQRSADDYCRSLKLEESDFVMPRKNFPLWRLITNDPLLIKAKIHEWSDGEVLCKNTPETTQCKQ
ncbi:hypothetical protein G4B88_023928 [Cannabis sativa]|uniref:Uncharacterized protein n=1 Tax=Cannabis sativa TaxID=3483 RepID=A0A7J6GKA0_CANSA|nr:hypothetical protein G4B88_023928 [Cannabis sativa]